MEELEKISNSLTEIRRKHLRDLGASEYTILGFLEIVGYPQTSYQVHEFVTSHDKHALRNMQSPTGVAVTLDRMVKIGLLQVQLNSYDQKVYIPLNPVKENSSEPTFYPDSLMKKYQLLTDKKLRRTITDAEKKELAEVRNEIAMIDESKKEGIWESQSLKFHQELAGIRAEVEAFPDATTPSK